jgi:hypothetical protein
MYDGAYYLAGYAVECALKACIAKDTRRHQFPDKKKVDLSHSHDLVQLIRVAGLEDEHRGRLRHYPDFEANWEVAKRWSEQSRYRKHSRESAHELLLAVTDKSHGVITWIKLHW